ncbi:hydrolase 2, exosortase A system-associated [Dechloromonas sp. A34]|uniref:hydrolase 2, exosortase A system-associated n=1 Tax=Dechloromonas sp. A34 TaxID=447588 RepID=UPI0022488900|nr:hydrolase 2, exosortase A system-associated [Dechloromonas sp. A34]
MRPFFLPGEGGQRFCLFHAPQTQPRGAVIYLHPFAEEMNKSRRMAALQARAMAEAGYAVLQIDLLGCGDSAGDFSDATWQAWQSDVLLAYRWLRTQTQAPLTLWGLRAGCLVAASVASQLPEAVSFIFWHPVISGKQHWQQFMRLKMAGELASGNAKGVTEQLRNQLAAGQAVEIAGYSVSPSLAEGLASAILQAPIEHVGKLSWFELSVKDDTELTPVSQKRIGQWQDAGFEVYSSVVRGPAFWQTTEVEEAQELIKATLAVLKDRE